VLLAVRHVGDEEWYGERVTRRKARIYDETGTTYSQERSGAESELPSGKSNSLGELQAGMSELRARADLPEGIATYSWEEARYKVERRRVTSRNRRVTR
jgi:hypothetical protein